MPNSGRDKVVRHVINWKRTLQAEEQVIGNQKFKQQKKKQRNWTSLETLH